MTRHMMRYIQQLRYWVSGLVGISGLALTSLVPGGPIETRSFAHISPMTLGVFNTFLTTLGLGSLLLVYFVLKSERWAMIFAAISGLSYLGVYGLDLAKIFPVSPDAMPPALFGIEVFGTILSVPLIVLSIQALQTLDLQAPGDYLPSRTNNLNHVQIPRIVGVIILGCVALGMIVFATFSAMAL